MQSFEKMRSSIMDQIQSDQEAIDQEKNPISVQLSEIAEDDMEHENHLASRRSKNTCNFGDSF